MRPANWQAQAHRPPGLAGAGWDAAVRPGRQVPVVLRAQAWGQAALAARQEQAQGLVQAVRALGRERVRSTGAVHGSRRGHRNGRGNWGRCGHWHGRWGRHRWWRGHRDFNGHGHGCRHRIGLRHRNWRRWHRKGRRGWRRRCVRLRPLHRLRRPGAGHGRPGLNGIGQLGCGLDWHAGFGRPGENRQVAGRSQRHRRLADRPAVGGARADRLHILIDHVADRALDRRVLDQQPQQRNMDHRTRGQCWRRHALARQGLRSGPVEHGV
jgi:hypothetical protein